MNGPYWDLCGQSINRYGWGCDALQAELVRMDRLQRYVNMYNRGIAGCLEHEYIDPGLMRGEGEGI